MIRLLIIVLAACAGLCLVYGLICIVAGILKIIYEMFFSEYKCVRDGIVLFFQGIGLFVASMSFFFLLNLVSSFEWWNKFFHFI